MSAYEEEQRRLQRLMNTVFKNEELEEDRVEVDEESSNTEQEFEDVGEDSAEPTGRVIFRKGIKTIWKKYYNPSNYKCKIKNMVKVKLPFVRRKLRNLQTPLEIRRSFLMRRLLTLCDSYQ